MSVTLHTVVATLPTPGDYIILQCAESKEKCGWDANTQKQFLALIALVEKESEDPNLSLTKVLPYYAQIEHPTGRLSTLYTEVRHEVTILGPAGREDEPHGLRIVVIHKAPGRPYWRDSFVTACSDLKLGNWNSLEARSNREFLRRIAERDAPAAKNLKFVAVPADKKVRLTMNKTGEYVQEVAKVWA